MFQASYAVTGLAHSARFDNSVYLNQYSHLVPTYYALEIWVCMAIWSGRSFKLPGFDDEKFKMTEEDFFLKDSHINQAISRFSTTPTLSYVVEKNAGIYFTWPVDWVTPGDPKFMPRVSSMQN